MYYCRGLRFGFDDGKKKRKVPHSAAILVRFDDVLKFNANIPLESRCKFH